ncbi:PilZ domain-containing protein [Spirochaetota bacterium]
MFFKKKKSKETTEQRNYPRAELLQQTYCNFEFDSKASNAYNCWIKNISEGGIAFSVDYTGFSDFNADIATIMFKLGTKIYREKLLITSKKKEILNWRCGCQFADENNGRDEDITNYISTTSE